MEPEILTIRFVGRNPYPAVARIGMLGENNVERIRFLDLPEFPGGTAVFNAVLPDGTHADVLSIVDNMVSITDTITPESGSITAWVTIVADNEAVWKSEKLLLWIGDLPDIGEIVQKQYPSALEDAIAWTTEKAREASESAESASGSAADAKDEAEKAESAKEASETAQGASERAQVAAEAAQGAAERAQGAAGRAQGEAENSERAAAGSAETAGTQAENSEAWAVGRRGGEDVSSGDPAYHNNAKYYAGQASGSATDAGNAKTDAEAARDRAEAAAALAQSAAPYAITLDADFLVITKLAQPEEG